MNKPKSQSNEDGPAEALAGAAGSADWARIEKLKAEIKHFDHQRKLRESEINGILIARMTRARHKKPNF